ncbi:MAG: CoA pyrophosphatase [Peptostreptococcaceae bacterium]|nr:CoA pyrophosphatase [Peptostreptococcaceae bacterium]
MDFNLIRKKLHNHFPIPEGNNKLASVLLPIVEVDGRIHLLFEVRSSNLKTQPREICFPGGGIEKNEAPSQSALRETMEELNLTQKQIRLIGAIDRISTPFNLFIYCYVGILDIKNINNISFSRDEVQSVFTVPLDFFLENDPHIHYLGMKLDIPVDFPFDKIQNGKGYNWRNGHYPVHFYEYDGNVIWGMTARMVHNFANILKDID